jgi:hypothetical protein
MVILMKEIGLMIRNTAKVQLLAKTLGKLNTASGDQYEGDWIDDRMQGNGICL